MEFLKADITFSEILNPALFWCKSGHEVPPGTKMYSVSGSTLQKSSWGDYCQHCVALASRAAAEQKQANRPAPPPDEPESLSLNQLKHRLKALGFGGLAEEEPKEIPDWERFIAECK